MQVNETIQVSFQKFGSRAIAVRKDTGAVLILDTRKWYMEDGSMCNYLFSAETEDGTLLSGFIDMKHKEGWLKRKY